METAFPQSGADTPLEVWYTGLYAQEEWQAGANFKLTYGLRFDVPVITSYSIHYTKLYDVSGIWTGLI